MPRPLVTSSIFNCPLGPQGRARAAVPALPRAPAAPKAPGPSVAPRPLAPAPGLDQAL